MKIIIIIIQILFKGDQSLLPFSCHVQFILLIFIKINCKWNKFIGNKYFEWNDS